MKNQTSQKQAYQAPVVRSVEFKVEQGFAGSTMHLTETVGEHRTYSNDGDGNSSLFSYSGFER